MPDSGPNASRFVEGAHVAHDPRDECSVQHLMAVNRNELHK